MKYGELIRSLAKAGFGAKLIICRDSLHKVLAEKPGSLVDSKVMAMILTLYACTEGDRPVMERNIKRLLDFWNQPDVAGTKNDVINQFWMLLETVPYAIDTVTIDPTLPTVQVKFKPVTVDGEKLAPEIIAERWATAQGMRYNGGDTVMFPERAPNEPERAVIAPTRLIQYNGSLFTFLARMCDFTRMAADVSKMN